MKSIFTAILFVASSVVFGQAYTGKDDIKFQVGANFQENGTGIVSTFDYGVGENISIGVKGMYLLGVEEFSDVAIAGTETTFADAEFGDRFDLRVRFNANLGNVINIDENFDLYPGLDLGLKNFGGHLGARYFFSPGFGIFTELNVPFAQYTQDEDFDLRDRPRKELNNQFNFSIGASFNL
ncbi:hypothetical protein EAX61_14520 [Dokdonia sinensis]|uniref:Outer membrane protein beta-barrel domain-containing protein n=1 Tax=Dokdonia sinensis TaxID=2479847 RepID=A0A3M0FVB6_9FLAO|nr:DUF6646 family protein [Dokdonia sinensis]RMB56448.1 hypothetical protein EAX61_14520 [Dokdonia sinensis]